MPAYDFICERCGAEREVSFHRQIQTSYIKVVCPACGEPMRKCFPAVAFQFAMSGQYHRQRAARKSREATAYEGRTQESTEYGED